MDKMKIFTLLTLLGVSTIQANDPSHDLNLYVPLYDLEENVFTRWGAKDAVFYVEEETVISNNCPLPYSDSGVVTTQETEAPLVTLDEESWQHYAAKHHRVHYPVPTTVPFTSTNVPCERSIIDKNAREPFLSSFYSDINSSHLEGKGIGFHHGYSSLRLFLAPLSFEKIQPFLDVRGHILNNGEAAYNFGLGIRSIDYDRDKVFGFNLYYDYRRSCQDYHQLGAGLEMLGPIVDLRINGYLPIGKQSRQSSGKTHFYPDDYWAQKYYRFHAMGGVDAEVFTSLSKFCYGAERMEWNPFIAIGPYYFYKKSGNNVSGGKLRFGVSYTDLFSMEMRVSYDKVYHTIVQGLFTLKIPFPSSGGYYTQESEEFRPLLLQPVQRNEIIAIHRKTHWHANFSY